MFYNVRLPGFGGAAVLFRSTPARDPATDGPADRYGVDVWLVFPDACQAVLARCCDGPLMGRLHPFLLQVAAADYPEKSVSALADETAGLVLDVVGSDAMRVSLEVSLVQDPAAQVVEHLGLRMETTRAAVLIAAEEAQQACSMSG